MTTDEALRVGAEACLIAPSAHGVDVIRITRDFRRPSSEYDEAAAALDKLRERLGRDRDALRKVREEMANCESLGYGTVSKWVTALDAILAEEP